MLLGLKQVFRLPLRALQGFVTSLRKLAFANPRSLEQITLHGSTNQPVIFAASAITSATSNPAI